MKYVIEKFYEDAKITIETNDPEVAVLEIMESKISEVYSHCFSGETGEVLAIVNHPTDEEYLLPEFSLMMLGVLATF